MSALESWERPYRTGPCGDALIHFVAFGEIGHGAPLSATRYRSAGVPEGIQVIAYRRETQPGAVDGWLQGHVWEVLLAEDPALAETIRAAPACTVVTGTVADPGTLDYLRDVVGLLTFFLDHGARAIYDPQSFRWWSPEAWRAEVFEPAGPVPHRHVTILLSEDETAPGLGWYHTRGLRKFGRPDLSVRRVAPGYQEGVIDLIQRFIGFQAAGATIPEGQAVRMGALPDGGVARHGGDPEDPEFNNLHLEIRWENDALATDPEMDA